MVHLREHGYTVQVGWKSWFIYNIIFNNENYKARPFITNLNQFLRAIDFSSPFFYLIFSDFSIWCMFDRVNNLVLFNLYCSSIFVNILLCYKVLLDCLFMFVKPAQFHKACKHNKLRSMKCLSWLKQGYQPNCHVSFRISKEQLNTSIKQLCNKYKFGW